MSCPRALLVLPILMPFVLPSGSSAAADRKGVAADTRSSQGPETPASDPTRSVIEQFDPATPGPRSRLTYRVTTADYTVTFTRTQNADGTDSEPALGGTTIQATFTPWRNRLNHGRLEYFEHNGWLPEGARMHVGLTWSHSFTVSNGIGFQQRTRHCAVTAYTPSMMVGDTTVTHVFTTVCTNQSAEHPLPLIEIVLWGPGRVFLRYTETMASTTVRLSELITIEAAEPATAPQQ